MTNVFFKNGRAIGTDENYDGKNYDDVELISGLPRDYDFIGRTLQQIQEDERQNRKRRREGNQNYRRQPAFASA